MDRDLNRREDAVNARNTGSALAPLDQLDGFKVADGDPDIRGWDVVGPERQKVGEVHDLIVDTAAMRVRYIDIEVDKKFADGNRNRHILLPVGCARLNEDRDDVLIDNISAADLSSAPEYRHEPITRELETAVRGCFSSAGGAGASRTAATTGGATDDFYRHQHFEDRNFWGRRREGRENESYVTRFEEELAVGKRQVRAGEVDVRKTVETERVQKQVPVTREEVTVERRPVDSAEAARGKGEIGEEEIRVPVMEEEVIVEKRAVPKEEVVIKKTAKTEQKTVEADVRKERIDVEGEGDLRRDRDTR